MSEDKENVSVFICGPSTGKCKCNCPESCEHKWDGPFVDINPFGGGGGGSSVTCSRCGMDAMQHDLWVMP